MSVAEPLKSSKENVDKLLSHENSKSDAPAVQTSVVQISSPPVHQPIEIGTSPIMQLPITTVENEVHNTTSASRLVQQLNKTPLGGAGLYPIKPCRTRNKLVHQLHKTPLGGARLHPIKSHLT